MILDFFFLRSSNMCCSVSILIHVTSFDTEKVGYVYCTLNDTLKFVVIFPEQIYGISSR